MPRPEGLDKYVEGYVNDPSRSKEENEASAKSIQEHFKLKKTEQEAQPDNSNESAIDFKKRMETELQEQFFNHANNEKIDGQLLMTMVEECVKLVRAKYWTPQRRDLAYRTLSDLANNKGIKPRAREMAARVLAKVEDQDLKAEAQDQDRNDSIAA